MALRLVVPMVFLASVPNQAIDESIAATSDARRESNAVLLLHDEVFRPTS